MTDDLDHLNLNIPDQIYVQTKERQPFNTENPPLAFATQVSNDSAFKKRKDTVDHWSGPTYRSVPKKDADGNLVMRTDYPNHPEYVREENPMTEGHILDNTPLSGFTFEKSVSRWTTSNKWFTINDPRGFQLQIAADNLGDIIINSGILKGELQGEFVWSKNKSNIFLTRSDHKAYIEKFKPKVEHRPLQLGDVVVFGQELEEYVFLGAYYSHRFDFEGRYLDSSGNIMHAGFRPPYGYWGNSQKYTSNTYLVDLPDNKKVYVFCRVKDGVMQFGLTEFECMHVRRTPGKYKIVSEQFPITEQIKTGKPYSTYSSLPCSTVSLFFDTLDELKSVGQIDVESARNIMESGLKGRYSYYKDKISTYPYLGNWEPDKVT